MAISTLDEREKKRMEAHFKTGADKNNESKFVWNETGVKAVLGPDQIKRTETVFIKNCHNCEYTISGKCTKVLIEGCTNTKVTLQGHIITEIIEAWKCDDFNLICNTSVKTLQLDLCKKFNLRYQNRDRFHQVIWSGVYDLSLGFDDEAQPPFVTGFAHVQASGEFPDLQHDIDQFIIRSLNGKITNEQVVRLANGYPTTEREAQEFDTQKEKNEKAAEDFVRRRLAEGGITLGKKKEGPKPGRNETCTCGSGKKYKKCCALKK
jgi:hypothetical protein